MVRPMVRGLGARAAPRRLLLVACASPPRPVADRRVPTTVVELAAFEVRDDGIDRFEHCPPPGEIGQGWSPPIPEWHPPSASASAAVPESALDAAGASPTPAAPGDAHRAADRRELVVAADRRGRGRDARRASVSCYHQGLMYDPTQDGHVGVVLRVDRAGHVAAVETWGACDLTPEALVCMRDEAAHLHLPPPESAARRRVDGAGGLHERRRTAPSRPARERRLRGGERTSSVEAMRPRLHACLGASRREGTGVVASALMSVDVDAEGQGRAHRGRPVEGLPRAAGLRGRGDPRRALPPPPAGKGKVIVPVVFNPSPGTR